MQRLKRSQVSKRAPGRLSTFKSSYCEQATKLCMLGATNADIARFFDVALPTIDLWIRKYSSFRIALKEGREHADANVGKRLYERAMGYTHPEEKIFVQDGRVIRVNTTKHYPPDTTACIFWLKNRRPDRWRDRQEITGAEGSPLQVDHRIELVLVGQPLPGQVIEGKARKIAGP